MTNKVGSTLLKEFVEWHGHPAFIAGTMAVAEEGCGIKMSFRNPQGELFVAWGADDHLWLQVAPRNDESTLWAGSSGIACDLYGTDADETPLTDEQEAEVAFHFMTFLVEIADGTATAPLELDRSDAVSDEALGTTLASV